MNAVLLAAGLGTRLAPLTDILPKCLMPINGRPLLEYWIEALRGGGVDRMRVNLHYFPEVVREWVGGLPNCGFLQPVHETELLGTGGTLLKNRDIAEGGPVMLVHADNLCSAPIDAFIQAHRGRPDDAVMTMMTFETSRPSSCGIVAVDERGLVRTFYEKVSNPPGNRANAAVYIVEQEVISFLEKRNRPFIDFSTEVLPHFMGRIFTFHNNWFHKDIGTPESYLSAHREFDGPQPARSRSRTWKDICRRAEASFGDALSVAVGGMPAERGTASDVHPPGSGKTRTLFTADSTAAASEMVEGGGLGKDRHPVLFIRTVSPTYSAKRFYDAHGVENLAMCAAAAG